MAPVCFVCRPVSVLLVHCFDMFQDVWKTSADEGSALDGLECFEVR